MALLPLNPPTIPVQPGNWDSLMSLLTLDNSNALQTFTPQAWQPKDAVLQTTFQSGHGFTAAAPSSGTQVDDTADFLLGTQSVKLTTTGASGVQATRKTAMTALDATARYLAVTLKVDHPERLVSCRLDVSSDVFTNWSSADMISPSTNVLSPYFVPEQWVTVLLPWGAFTVGGGAGATRSALTGFQVRCTDDGTGPVVMRVNKISAVAEPANAILTFSFDDGYASHFTIAKPIMDAVGLRGCYAPIINKIATSNFMTFDQIVKMRDAGWEPMVHAYDIAIHNAYASFTDDVVIADMIAAKRWMRANNLGPADNFLIPQGQITTLARAEAFRSYFNISRTAYTRVRETYPPARPYALRAYTLSPAHLAADITAKIDEAIANKEWLVLEIHDIVAAGGDGTTTYLTADFQTVVNYVISTGIKVKTFTEVAASGVA